MFGQMFDRDEPSREKEMYLTVRATDNGNPQLDDVCTIKVTIDDINDNSPVFDKVVSSHLVYSQKVLEKSVYTFLGFKVQGFKNS